MAWSRKCFLHEYEGLRGGSSRFPGQGGESSLGAQGSVKDKNSNIWRWGEADEVTQSQPLVSRHIQTHVHMHLYKYTHTHTHQIRNPVYIYKI